MTEFAFDGTKDSNFISQCKSQEITIPMEIGIPFAFELDTDFRRYDT